LTDLLRCGIIKAQTRKERKSESQGTQKNPKKKIKKSLDKRFKVWYNKAIRKQNKERKR